MNISRMCGAGI